ncbi:MAG: DUF1566 domain-containing protein [Desulfobacterales bacterium]|nr:DUF1566 domain-containing protein [Desulfobacterales bacterium]
MRKQIVLLILILFISILSPSHASETSVLDEYLALKQTLQGESDFRCNEDVCIDITTNLMWKRQGFVNETNRQEFETRAWKYDTRPRKEVLAWVAGLNNRKAHGVIGWRLPTRKEYPAIWDRKNCKRLVITGGASDLHIKYCYRKEINGKGQYALASDEDNTMFVIMDWQRKRGGGKLMGNRVTGDAFLRYFEEHPLGEGIAVREGPLDLYRLLKTVYDKNQPVPPRLSDRQKMIFDRAVTAYKNGLDDTGDMLFETLVDQCAVSLHHYNYHRMIVEKKLPLKMAGQILAVVRSKQGDTPLIWFEAAHMAGLANQPALVFKAAKKMASLTPPPELKEVYLDQISLFDALAYMQMDQKEKAYSTLLLRFELNKNLLLPYYLNTHATPLLKDKKKLSEVTMIPEPYLTGDYKVLPAQDFYNVETGEILKAARVPPEMESGTVPLSTGHKTGQSNGGATVLD